MKTLVNKRNPAIRITAPEIVLWVNKEEYLIAGIPQTARTYLAKEWTLVEGEPEVELEEFTEKMDAWKPSEEQMEELNKVRILNPGLDALYQQLKNM